MERDELIYFLGGRDDAGLFERAASVKAESVGPKTYLRGLIELSNVCRKNCYYCGIRSENQSLDRYSLSRDEILAAARYAYENGYGSVALQAGERQNAEYVAFIEEIIHEIRKLSHHELGITLSLGEQSKDTYSRWFAAGGGRYLLRIETSYSALYASLHPASHTFEDRVKSLEILKKTGYQLGTGVMIGLPGQTTGQLADDLLFMRAMDIDMCGMGPYIENPTTTLPITNYSLGERFDLSLRMIALLRILMPTINIASTTALHALRQDGRQRGIAVGANVIMPNLTPRAFREGYLLYDNKPTTDTDLSGFDIAYGQKGDSRHFTGRNNGLE